MKKNLPIFVFTFFLLSCSSVKKTQKAINYGNYDEAINIALKNLRTNKTKKSKQTYVLMLEDAFAKAVARDKEKIKYLKADGNSANLENIYNLYIQLDNRQKNIKPLLPLPILDKGTNAKFNFENYDADIMTYRDK